MLIYLAQEHLKRARICKHLLATDLKVEWKSNYCFNIKKEKAIHLSFLQKK